MPQILFSFTLNTETNEVVFSGNIDLPVALTILQNIVIMDAVRRAQEDGKQEVDNQAKEEAKAPEEQEQG